MNKQPVEKKILEVRKTFKERFGDTAGLRFFAAPGRVNLIG